MAKDYSRVATLDALTKPEGKGGRATVVVPEAVRAQVDEAYRARIAKLKKHAFWGMGEADYRPDVGLRWPQRRAVAFVQAYLAANKVPGACAAGEAALIKMPTGTGKSGVIAALACASPGVTKTLILTPRTSLVRQMAEDLTTRFWKKLGAHYTRGGLIEGVAQEALDALPAEPEDIKDRPVRRLVAEQYHLIKQDEDNERQIWVGTFNALHLLLGVEPPAHRSFQGRDERPAGAAFGPGKDGAVGLDLEAFRKLIKSVDLVIVDEGHHEPAYSWAQAIRKLGKPTVIFTATPYRNDYKYFQVSGKFIFNLPWSEAVDERLIRDVKIAPSPEGDGVADDKYSAKLFVNDFKSALEGLPAGKKAIVHAKSFGDLKRIQRALLKEAGESAVLIHEKIKQPRKKKAEDVKEEASDRVETLLADLSFGHVHQALKSSKAMAARVWLHQYKLLEGVDIAEFIEIWLFDDFGSARQLVQQIGRAIRLPDPNDEQGRIATIRAARKRLTKFEGAPTIAERTHERWKGYLAYERYAQAQPEVAFTAETQLLETLKRASPEVQYVAREFREGRLFSEPPTMSGFMLPCRATVCRIGDKELAEDKDKHLNELAAAAREAMMLEDRFDIVAVEPGSEPEHADARLIRYLAWRNSPLLIAHQIPEWTMGLLAIVRAGRYIFLLDTEGNCLDLSRLKLATPEAKELKRLFPEHKGKDKQKVRIVETTAKGLDVSELGLRSISVRRHALDNSYFDLAEASQTPTTIVGYSPFAGSTARRRLSLARSNLTDATNQFVSLKLYVDWTRKVAAVMSDDAIRPHGYFDRFAKEVPPLDATLGEPKSILLDLADLFPEKGSPKDKGWKRAEIEKVLKEDTCCPVVPVPNTKGGVDHHFVFANIKVDIRYEYYSGVPARGRYVLKSEALNKLLTDEAEDLDEGSDDEVAPSPYNQRLSPSLTRLLNVDQAFEVVPASSGVVYSHGHFYEPEVDKGLLSILEGEAAIIDVVSEKGDTRVDDKNDWNTKTLFGKIEDWGKGDPKAPGLAGDLARASVLICDDSSVETADFYAIIDTGSEKRILIIHAKAAETANPSASAGRLQDVARQAQASLALAGSARSAVPSLRAWKKTWSVYLDGTSKDPRDANGKRIGKRVDRGDQISRARLWKPLGGDIGKAREQLLAALADPTYTREVVILTVGLLSLSAADQTFTNRAIPDNQFIYFLASVRTSFDRAGVRLRIVCNP